jgi:hypothetical protein
VARAQSLRRIGRNPALAHAASPVPQQNQARGFCGRGHRGRGFGQIGDIHVAAAGVGHRSGEIGDRRIVEGASAAGTLNFRICFAAASAAIPTAARRSGISAHGAARSVKATTSRASNGQGKLTVFGRAPV